MKQKGRITPPQDQLQMAMLTLNILNFPKHQPLSAFYRHWSLQVPYLSVRVKWENPLTGCWRGPDPRIRAGRGFGCVFPQGNSNPGWVPARNLKYPLFAKECHPGVTFLFSHGDKKTVLDSLPHCDWSIMGHQECCFYANPSSIIKDKVKTLQEDLAALVTCGRASGDGFLVSSPLSLGLHCPCKFV